MSPRKRDVNVVRMLTSPGRHRDADSSLPMVLLKKGALSINCPEFFFFFFFFKKKKKKKKKGDYLLEAD